MNNSKNRGLSQGAWKTSCAFWTKVHGDFPETRKSSSLVYRASTPCLSLWERWLSEAKTERGNGCGKPAQSPSVTALPEGEPRGWICWRKKWSISIPIRSIHCFYGRPFNLPPLNYFCFLARYASGSMMPFASIFSAQSCRASTVTEIFSNSS